MNILPDKQPHEQFVHTVDFQNLTSVALTYVNATAKLLQGTVDDSADIVYSTITSDGAVNLTIRRGTTDNDYAIKTMVSDANGNVFEDDLVLRVREVL